MRPPSPPPLSSAPHPPQLAMQFISQYSPEDIVTAHIEGSSGALWRISPPSRAQMKRELSDGTADITLRFTWNFQRCGACGRREAQGGGSAGAHAGLAPTGTWPRAAPWSTPTRSTRWAWPPTARSGGSWPACSRALRTSPCEWGARGTEMGGSELSPDRHASPQGHPQTLPEIHPGSQWPRGQPSEAAAAW